VAQRVSWLKDYPGGDCFFATAISVTDKATDIEAFGTSVEPFVDMMQRFQSQFGMEPNIDVRVLEPQQCVVANFLRSLSNSAGNPPQLKLDQTTVANGAALSGEIEALDGRKTDLILVDHKGMAYNLNSRLADNGNGAATFSIKLGLGAADLAKKESVPQIVVAVTSREGVPAANFTGAVPASELFPRISQEMGSQAGDATAIAKYFRLGG
jgi:serine/threonine-protein kinase